MFEKNLTISQLLDEYAPVLSPRHRELLDYYYNQDLSLAEIAAEIGISRQGVRDGIKKAEEELFFLENGLHLLQRAEAVRALVRKLVPGCQPEAREAIRRILLAAGIENEESEGAPDGNV